MIRGVCFPTLQGQGSGLAGGAASAMAGVVVSGARRWLHGAGSLFPCAFLRGFRACRAVVGVASLTGPPPPPPPLLPTVDAGPLRPGGGAEAAALLGDAGDSAHPQGGVRGPTALPGLLREARQRGPLCSKGRGPRERPQG